MSSTIIMTTLGSATMPRTTGLTKVELVQALAHADRVLILHNAALLADDAPDDGIRRAFGMPTRKVGFIAPAG